MYTLEKEVIVNTSVQKAWKFMCNPANLNKITPDDMQFEIITELPDQMYDGMLVEYRVKIPFMGTQPWLSELKHIVPLHTFVDEQKVGPYKLWYHYHAVEEHTDGVKLIDRVTYQVPFGIIGKLAHTLFIRKTLERIFAHRNTCFHNLLSDPSPRK